MAVPPYYEWPRPFPPYPIQHELMTALHGTLAAGRCGVFESPTGSGKTLSIISAVVPWIRANWNRDDSAASPRRPSSEPNPPSPSTTTTVSAPPHTPQAMAMAVAVAAVMATAATTPPPAAAMSTPLSSPAPAWVSAHQASLVKDKKTKLEHLVEQRNAQFRAYDAAGWPVETPRSGGAQKRARTDSSSSSEDDDNTNNPTTRALRGEEALALFSCRRKVFYCSRTHSQLSQFLDELRRSFPSRPVTAVALGSRSHLCVNTTLRQSCRTPAALNTACLESQDGSRPRCPHNNKAMISHLADAAVFAIRDVEEMYEMGKKRDICAYYAAREAMLGAEVVVLPYSMLLQESTRSSLDIDLRGHVVVCDEAHNLVDAIADAYAARVSLQAIHDAGAELKAYLSKYKTRFNLDNATVLQELVSVCTKLGKVLGEAPPTGGVVDLDKFIVDARLTNNNLFSLVQRIKDADLSRKLRGVARELRAAAATSSPSSSVSGARRGGGGGGGGANAGEGPALLPVLSFLEALTSRAEDGRVSLVMDGVAPKDKYLKFMLMNPAARFAKVVGEAHSVILTGGTMHPVEDMVTQLFPTAADRVDLFSCGHVIPKNNLTVLCGSRGPTKVDLTLTFAARDDANMLDELGRCVLDVLTVTPQGVVVFFPSYRFEAQAASRWEKTGLLAQMTAVKPVVREISSAAALSVAGGGGGGSGDTESTWTKYQGLITTSGAAVLFAVMGGRLSEGINFSDGLARSVVVVGMPYPNKQDAELQAKMAWLGPADGARYYESQCWKTVNQSVGRSIRHIKDYAAVVLLDSRYATATAKARLPKWIAERFDLGVAAGPTWEEAVVSGLRAFFAGKG